MTLRFDVEAMETSSMSMFIHLFLGITEEDELLLLAVCHLNTVKPLCTSLLLLIAHGPGDNPFREGEEEVEGGAEGHHGHHQHQLLASSHRLLQHGGRVAQLLGPGWR